MIAARQIAFGGAAGKGLSAKDYVFRSPVQHWDGIENVGYNTHDDNSTTWNSLVEGGMNLTLGEYGDWSDNALLCLGGRIPAYGDNRIEKGVVRHISLVAESEGTSGIIIALGQGSSTGAIIFNQRPNNEIAVTIVNSSSEGLANVIKTNSSRYSISINYDANGAVVDAYVDGVKQDPFYRFTSYDTRVFSVGDRTEFSSSPFTGKVHRIMIGGEHLTESEIAHNYSIDKARFGL